MTLSNRRVWAGATTKALRLFICAIFLLPLVSGSVVNLDLVTAAEEDAPPPRVETLPQDAGTMGLQEMLRRLGTTARLMQTVAHPDDEDGGMLTLESRGKGVSTVLLTLNRGEGGQNKLSSNLFDVLGVLRTLELTAADRYYGVEQRFTRVADFGFSKTADETFKKWDGGEPALADMVRVIRTFRPDVIAARFSGTDRDGHGHHQVSSLLARTAFRAAADPTKFTEQIKEGLLPWQAKKLYIGNVCGFNALTCPAGDYTLKLNTGVKDPVLGTSYIQFAMEGLLHQLSQGAGGWTVDPGDRFTYYKLVDSTLPMPKDHENDFFDGLDTSLVGLTGRLGVAESKVPYLRPDLKRMQALVTKAQNDPKNAVDPLLAGLQLTRELVTKVGGAAISDAAKEDLLVNLRTKEAQFSEAANLAGGMQLTAEVETPVAASADAAFMAVRGQSFKVQTQFASAATAKNVRITLEAPSGWKVEKLGELAASGTTFKVTVAPNADYTRPYWHRDNPETDALNTIDDGRYATLPFPPMPLQAEARYEVSGREGGIKASVNVSYKGADGEALERAVAVAPAYSVMMDPGQQVIATGTTTARPVTVTVSSNLPQGTKGTLRLEVPQGWRAEPAQMAVDLPARGTTRNVSFHVAALDTREGKAQVKAVLEAGSESFSEGYSVVTRDDLNTFYYYQPAVQRVSIVDVRVPQGLRVGYVMGAGDEIPSVLEQIGMNVTVLTADKFAAEDLSKYDTLVLGIRAYDTQKDLAASNARLLDWVKNGGTLVVQYNTGTSDFNAGKFTPYPTTLGRGRVSVEEAPVKILAPENPIFHSPNEISGKDFDGWIQERGLYFMSQWDAKFTPLLESHDPGEPEQKGGMLEAEYGKGIYIYTGYAFFRELPAGVPGAVRLYVNMLSAKGSGRQSASQ
jgi:LmbE family N-acetylglucosaminyl deacetylase